VDATVVAGGTFTGAGGVERDSLAALDLRTGRPTGWHPRLSSSQRPQPSVNAIALAGPTIYLGGDFDRVGGRPRTDVAAVTAAGGGVTSWAPRVTTDQVLAVAPAKPNIVFGGFGVGTAYTAAGKLVWSSPPTGGIDSVVDALAVVGGTVYAGGNFSVIGGANRTALAALDASNGSAAAWNPRVTSNDEDTEVDVLAVAGSRVYVGGHFNAVAGSKRSRLASFDSGSNTWTSWAPNAGPVEDVYALAVTPGAIYAGGEGGAAAFDPKSGARLGWMPTLSPGLSFNLVHTIAVVGSTVYLGDEGGLLTEPVAR
jgi:hypothetical protein